MVKKTIAGGIVAAAIVGAIYWYSGNGGVTSGDVSFTGIEQGFHGGREAKENLVIRDQAAWGEAWQNLSSREFPPPSLPEVDFESQMVIAVFMGVKNSGGYATEITAIKEGGDSIAVFVEETSPGPNCAVTLALTSPFHIVKMKKSDKAVEFSVTQEVNECSR